MENKKSITKWWIPFLIGILMVAVSIVFLTHTVETFIGLSILFAFSIFVSGGSYMAFALSNRKVLESWGWYLFLGILEMLIGVALLFQPHISMEAFILFIGFWLTFYALHIIHYAFILKNINFSSWWLQLILGLFILIFGFLTIINPIIGIFSIVYFTAFPIMMIGIAAIALGWKLKEFEIEQ